MATLTSIVGRYKKRLERVPQIAALSLSDLTITGTPYDEGSAQASYTASLGAPVFAYRKVEGGPRYPQRATVAAVANALKPGGRFTLGNGAPYINRLEYVGWSDQAPAGFLRVATAQWQAVVDQAAVQARGI